jgi:hypothetical protein
MRGFNCRHPFGTVGPPEDIAHLRRGPSAAPARQKAPIRRPKRMTAPAWNRISPSSFFWREFDFGATMSKADEYHARATQCRIRAAETIDPDFKREFEQLAQKWNDLAIQEEIDSDCLPNPASQPPQPRGTKAA